MDTAPRLASLWLTAGLVGAMRLFAGGFAAFLFTPLPVKQARQRIRKAFPPFYRFVIAAAALAAGSAIAFAPGRGCASGQPPNG